MNNKAHLRPKDFDSSGDIIPMSWKEEKGDLISRSELKKAIEPYRYAICGFEGVLALIDNAPTISSYKAIHDELHSGYYICDNCGEVVEKNYCPNCGLRKVKK